VTSSAPAADASTTASSASPSNFWNRLEARNFEALAMSWPIQVPFTASQTLRPTNGFSASDIV